MTAHFDNVADRSLAKRSKACGRAGVAIHGLCARALEPPCGGILFQGDTHQLAFTTDTHFQEQLLQSRLDGGFGDLKPDSDLFVAQAVEDVFENISLAVADLGAAAGFSVVANLSVGRECAGVC